MVSTVYTPGELLRMRHAFKVDSLAHDLRVIRREDPELSDKTRKPSERYPERKLTRILEDTREIPCDSNGYITAKRISTLQLDGAESEWKYRGRTDSENAEPQPISAPTGLAAQKDEGFQRFYRAVVSPTHVRVTAGGRIVPNNRGFSSPTTKWSKDETAADDTFMHQLPQCSQAEQNGFPISHTHFAPLPSMYPGFSPGVSPGIAPGSHPYPMMPWHMGMNMGGSFAIPVASGNLAGANANLNKSTSSSRSDEQSQPGVPEQPNPSHSFPSEQVEYARPVFYNGQWMIPSRCHYYPYAMGTGSMFSSAPFSIPIMGPHGMAMGPNGASAATGKNSQSTENDARDGPSASVPRPPPAFAPSSNPPTSSIRPSEITKRHLDILRSRLRYLEDQLSYNKHQIDERAIKNDTQMVRQYIQQFEKNLEVQVCMEERQHLKTTHKNDADASFPSNGAAFSKSSASSDGKPQKNQESSSIDQSSNSRWSKREKVGSRLNSGINSTKSASAFAGWKAPTNSPSNSYHLHGKSTLPVDAALAAPFQPKTEATVTKLNLNLAMTASGQNHKEPYLVGYLPNGINPDLAKDTDYMYGRPLTEDELRARHMYWGNAPQNLQQGLPKFNGKDFFPASPAKFRSSDEAWSPEPSAHVASDSDLLQSLDPFPFSDKSSQILTRNGPGNSTQSESLSTENLTVTTNRPMPCGVRVGRSLDELNTSSHETVPTSSDSLQENLSSDEDEDDRELIFTGRNSMARTGKSHNNIWSSMLKNGKTSADAIPGAISSMTVQGVLPRYDGHATASLTPTIANKATSPRSSVTKPYGLKDIRFSSLCAQKHSENCPPYDVGINKPCHDENV